MVFSRVQWIVFVKVACIEEIQILGHILVEVLSFDMATEGVCVGKEECTFVAIFRF